MVDENARIGGSLDLPAWRQRSRRLQLLRDLDERVRSTAQHQRARAARSRPGTTPITGWRWSTTQRMTKMRARAVIVASGVFEQPAVFRNNDLPGVMLASAAQRLIYRYAVKPMQARGRADRQRRRLCGGARSAAARRRGRGGGRPAPRRRDSAPPRRSWPQPACESASGTASMNLRGDRAARRRRGGGLPAARQRRADAARARNRSPATAS